MKEELDYRAVSIGTANLRNDEKGVPQVLYGTPIVYNSRSQDLGWFVERFEPRAFSDWLSDSPDVYACCHHRDDQLLGRTDSKTLRIKEDERGVHIDCDLPQTSYAADLVSLINRGDIRGMSFGFVGVDEEWGKEDGKMLRVIKKAKLYEVSFVTNPAYQSTSAGVRSRRSMADAMKRPPLKLRIAQLKLLEMQSK